jgi:alpha-N-arabinofuranosidase
MNSRIDMKKNVLRLLLATVTAAHLAAAAAPVKLTVQAGTPGPQISPTMWGVFFEDINFGADGGLYAELVKNRSFEFPDPLMGWIKLSPSLAKGELSVLTDSPLNANNPHYLRLQSEGTAPFGISNEGFRGMGLLADETYDFSAQARLVSGAPRLLIQLVGEDGSVLAETKLEDFSPSAWKKCAAALKPKAQESKARLNVILENKGAVDLDMVSLFPRHTWKGRPGGLRADMVQLLADFKPGFMRFPGGCIVEGSQLDRRYQWKNTIGPIEERKLLINRWNYEFIHRPTPDYFQSFGLGFFEFFQLCEDIGSEPLPILNCGMACQFNSGELCPLDQLEPFIQDALDLVEFANGPADSPWGAKRAAMGRPEPFHLKMMGIGNEQWGPQYIERYARFAKALKGKYPEIMLVSASGPSPDDDRFKFLWSKLRELQADIVDEHCYANPSWFFDNTHRYDHYDRSGPKVFMGEYAAQSVGVVSVKNRNTLECALAEAAYMTGLERNADVVRMASYAPLFANAQAWQWTPDMIWVNSLQAFGTPNYYAQMLFSRNRGSVVLPVSCDNAAAAGAAPSFFVSAARDDAAGEIIIKAVNSSHEPVAAAVDLEGVATVSPAGQTIVLASARLTDQNTFEDPAKVSPKTSPLEIVVPQFNYSFEPYSLTVLRIKATEK